jgi:hypothetical protein
MLHDLIMPLIAPPLRAALSFPLPVKQAPAKFIAGWSSPVARQAHNLKVVSSNLAPATKYKKAPSFAKGLFFVE